MIPPTERTVPSPVNLLAVYSSVTVDAGAKIEPTETAILTNVVSALATVLVQ